MASGLMVDLNIGALPIFGEDHIPSSYDIVVSGIVDRWSRPRRTRSGSPFAGGCRGRRAHEAEVRARPTVEMKRQSTASCCVRMKSRSWAVSFASPAIGVPVRASTSCRTVSGMLSPRWSSRARLPSADNLGHQL